MSSRFVFALCALLSLSTSASHAQPAPPETEPSPDLTPSPDLSPTPSPNPDPTLTPNPTPSPTPSPSPNPSPAPSAPRPAPPSSAACILGAHDGIPDPDASTSAALLCEALIDAGAHVTPGPISNADAASYTAAYRVDMRPLGKLIVLQVGFESPIGTRLRGRTAQLGSIEEVPVAAVRLADALLNDKPLENTASVTTLVGQETRKYKKEYGETLFGFGVFGVAIPDATFAGYGAFARLYYESTRYAVGADLRIGGSSESDGDASVVGVSVGARYFFTDGDVAPFTGGGAGILWLSEDRDDSYEDQVDLYADDYDDRTFDGSGLAPYLELGIEFLRFHDSRFDLLLRTDVPIFKLEDGDDRSYAVPIALMASYSL